MEDSVKGMIVTFTIISIFIMAITSFVFLFPQEQGYSFTEIENNTFLVLNQIEVPSLSGIDNSSDSGYSKWDIEVGQMGSNTQKSSKTSVTSYVGSAITSIKVLAYEVFTTDSGSIHPVIVVLGILTSLAGVYITYLFIKFIRTGA